MARPRPSPHRISRRDVMIAGGGGLGLLAGFALWPRDYAPNVAHGAGERVFNPFLKIAANNSVTVIVPQLEYGQGIGTALAQIVADELGAPWTVMALQPALIHPDYGNPLFDPTSSAMALFGERAPMATGGATSIRAFEMRLREAAAAARIVLQMAAAKRWKTDWRTLTTSGGFVRGAGKRQASFGELAEAAAGFTPPATLAFRAVPPAERLYGTEQPRLDAPAKVDGSLLFAGDVRLPGMAYASVRQAPEGKSVLKSIDRQAGLAGKGVIDIVETPDWVAAVATNWWAANEALDRIAPLFANQEPPADSLHAAGALKAELARPGQRIVAVGDADAALKRGRRVTADYAVDAALPAPLEPPAATAREQDGRWQIWTATQAPNACRAAIAEALGVGEDKVMLLMTPAGGAFGAGFDHRVAVQAAMIARKIGKPVQLCWSRAEAQMHGAVRPPARAHQQATLGLDGAIQGWRTQIAAPAIPSGGTARNPGTGQDHADKASVAAAAIPYAIPHTAIDHHPAATGLPLTRMRGEADGYSCFFREAFLDELAEQAGSDPLSFRMHLLLQQPAIARCLTTATMLGGWQGGAAKSPGQGLAVHSMDGSHIAVLASAIPTARGLRVERLVAAADVGRTVNPDLVRQQIEGGLIYGMAAALGASTRFTAGLGDARRLSALRLPLLSQSPEILVELIASGRAPGGASQIAVPPVAPAIAGAYYAATGRRIRRLPFSMRPVT